MQVCVWHKKMANLGDSNLDLGSKPKKTFELKASLRVASVGLIPSAKYPGLSGDNFNVIILSIYGLMIGKGYVGRKIFS